MERDNQNYNRDYRNNSNRNNFRNDNNEQFENYRDRYSSSDGGNYYGMRDEDAEYRNVRSTGSNTYGAGPVGGYGASSWRGAQDNDQDQYRYGDPNPYMENDRNGGYERTRGTGWRDNNDRYSDYRHQNSNDKGRDQGREGGYSRGDNSYQYSGQGRRFSDFGRDEGRTYNRDRNSGYNIGTDDSYYDRSEFKYDREDNNYRGGGRSRNTDYSRDNDRYLDNDDFRYSGRIQSADSDRDENYATGLYASNRAYRSDNSQSDSDGDRVSSRQNRSGRSGPDYRASSSASDYSPQGQVRG